MIRYSAAVIVLLLVLTGVRVPASASSTSGWDELSFEVQSNYRVFDIDSGLLFLGYMAVAQTPDGFIYTGGYGGLVRYDGRRFERLSGVDSVMAML